jgi:TolA-binding protein
MKLLKTTFLISGLAAACCAPLAAQEELPGTAPVVTAEAPKQQAEPAALPGVQPPAAVQAAEPAAKPAAEGDVVSAEWRFFLDNSADKDEDVLEMLLQGLSDWVAHNPENPGAGNAQYLKASLRYRLGDYKGALMDLEQHFYEYPQGASSSEAKKLFLEILEKKADKKMKASLVQLAGAVPAGDTAARLYVLLEKLPLAAGAPFYDSIIAQYRAYLNRFPGRAGNDNICMAEADMHLNMKKYLAARVGYEKMISVYPASPLIARAKLFLAVVLADELKEYDKAIKVFQDITVSLPGTDQAWAAYARLPELAEKQKMYQAAVGIYEEIIKLYPDKEEAYNAFVAEARVLREELEKPAEAVAVLERLADKYKGERAIEALQLAAEIYRKDLKDSAGEVRMYDRIAAEYPADPQAPKALYAAGEVFEKSKTNDKAAEYYGKVIAKYADNSMAKKAQKRIDAMNGK